MEKSRGEEKLGWEKSGGERRSGVATGGGLGEVGRLLVFLETCDERTRAQLTAGLWPKTAGINLSDGKEAPEPDDSGGTSVFCGGGGVPKLNNDGGGL